MRDIVSTNRNSEQSLDFTYNSQRQAYIKKIKKNARFSTGCGTVEQHTSHDETNILLNQETYDSPNDTDRRRDGDDSSTDMSIALEPGRTRRYYRCFKVNICLNITMLLVFVCLITFGEWYKMLYKNNELTLDAKFSLIIIYFEKTDLATGET